MAKTKVTPDLSTMPPELRAEERKKTYNQKLRELTLQCKSALSDPEGILQAARALVAAADSLAQGGAS